MNKKAVIKAGIAGLCVLMIVLVLSVSIYSNTSSATIIDKKTYTLGEKVKFNMEGIIDYRVKINTPSTSLLKKGSNDIFIYIPEEEGSYRITLEHSDKQESYFFQVTNNINELNDSSVLLANTTNLTSNVSTLVENESIVKLNNSLNEEIDEFLSDNGAKIIVNRDVKWNINERIDKDVAKVRIKVPNQAKNISAFKKSSLDEREELQVKIDQDTILESIANVFEADEYENINAMVENVQAGTDLELEYYTEGPTLTEYYVSAREKEVSVSSPEGLHYENVSSYASISEMTSNKDSIKIYWNEEDRYLEFNTLDIDEDGLIDHVYWEIPHLSEQSFTIVIEISSAEHLDQNRAFIKDLYREVRDRDDIWSGPINENEYLRIKFEKPLSNINDISIFPRIISGNPRIEVYEIGKDEKIAEFTLISDDRYNKIYLTNLNGSQDVFDLRIVGGTLEIDHIIDPTRIYSYNYVGVTQAGGPHKAYNVDLDAWPPQDGVLGVGGNTNAVTELTDAEYTNIGSSNDVRDQVPDPGAGDEPMLWSIMKINQTESEITRVDFLFEGFPAAAATISMYLYNDTSDAWSTTAIASAAFGTSDTVLRGNITSGIGDFINASGSLIWGIYSSTASEALNVDFVYVNITRNYTLINNPVTKINSTFGTNLTNETLNCFDTITHNDGNRVNVSVRWFNSSTLVLYDNYNNSYTNGTLFVASLSAGNTTRFENWTCSLSFYAENYSTLWVNSTPVFILNANPNQGTPFLNSTFGTNITNENLTVYNISTSDIDSDIIKNIISWNLNGSAFEVMNVPFDGNSSSATVKDYSRNRNNGTVFGGAFLNLSGGYDGFNSFVFNGTNSLINFSSNLSQWLGTTSSLAFWIKTTQNGSNNITLAPGITGVEQVGGSNDVFWGWINSSGTIGIQKGDTPGARTSGPINDGVWHHIVLIFNSTSGHSQVFLDGRLNGSALTASAAATTSFNRIGSISDTGGTPTFFVGSLDDIRIYNRVINTSQVYALYTNRTDMIVSNELKANDTWQACITPVDKYSDGVELCSGNLTVLTPFIPPVITIFSPTNNTIVKDVTPLLNVSVDQIVSRLWYTANNGITNITICNSCSGVQGKYLHLPEGTHTVRVYGNASVSNIGTNLTTFTINMNYSYYDSFDDNSSIDNLEKSVWRTGNVSSSLGIVFSVQNLGITLASGTASGISLLTKSQNASSSVPFVTMSHHTTGTAEDWENHLTHVRLNGTHVIVNRSSTAADLQFNISVVEFNPARVRVQSGLLCNAAVAGCNVTIPISVNRSRTALIFYPQLNGVIDDDSNSASVLGNITNNTHLTFYRTDITGLITGTWYLFESIDDSFTVQNEHISLNLLATANATISSVDVNRTFLIASTTATTATDDAADYSPRVRLANSTIVTANKGTAADNTQINVYTITFNRDLNVQRGTLTYAGGTASTSNSSLNPFNVQMSMAWNPTLVGRIQSDSVGADNIQGAFNRMELFGEDTILGTRGITVGNTLASYELLDFSTTTQSFTSLSINTSYNITQITNITWNEQNTDSKNNISLEISLNNGQNFYAVTKSQGLSGAIEGSSLIYRVLFNTNSSKIVYLLDLTINWSNASVPVPVITIFSPLNNTIVKDVTPLLNVSVSTSVDRLWYTANNGITNTTICTSCSGVQFKYLHLPEGNHTVRVYANDTANRLGTNLTTFIINMNYSYYDSFDDNSSIDVYSGTSWNVGSVNSTRGSVFSVQNLGIALASGAATASSSLTKSQNASSSIPFVTMSHHTTGAAEDWENHLTHVRLNSTAVIVNRSSTGADLQFNISVVEFNPSKVRVQSGSLCNAAVAGCNVVIPISVNRSRTALIFYPQIGGTIDDDSNSASVLGNISGDDQLTFYRTDTTGSITGTWYLFESIDDSFTVQNEHISLNTLAAANSTINHVDMNRTFLIGSYSTTTATDDAGTHSTMIDLINSTMVTATKGSATDNTQVNVYTITFNRDLNVQRGILSYATGTTTASDASLAAVNLNMSMAWNPTLVGRMQSDDLTADNLQSSFNRLSILNSTTILGVRGLSVGNTLASYEVLDFSATAQSFTSLSINVTDTINQITNITWSESGTDSINNITLQISANNGLNWTSAPRSQRLTSFVGGNALIYRALFNTNGTKIISLLDLMINWSNFASPTVVILYPQDQNYTTNVSVLNYSVSGTQLTSCWYTLNGGVTNNTITCGNNVTGLTSAEGSNNWSVYAQNINGETASDTVNFFKDSIVPNVTLNSPDNGTLFTDVTVSFNWSVIDNLDTLLSCNLTVDSVVQVAYINSTNGTSTTYSLPFNPGSHYWNVTCMDNLGNFNTSQTRVFTVSLQTALYQIIKGNGTATGAFTNITISPPLNNISKAFHFVTYKHNYVGDHADTFRSSELLNSTILRIYGDTAGGVNQVNFSYAIIEFSSTSPILVQRSNITLTSNDPTVPITQNFGTSINASESFLIYQGHTHRGADDTIGSEELDKITILNDTSWEFDVTDSPNTNPQENRVEVIDWNDNGFIKRVQRNDTTLMGAAVTTLTITPPTAVNPNKTLLIVNFMEGAGSATSEPPSEIGVFATLTQAGNIFIQRAVAGPELVLAWQLVEFQTGAVNVYHIQANMSNGQLASTYNIPAAVSANRSLTFGTSESPFGHSGSAASDTTAGAIDRNMFTIQLINNTAVRAIREVSTGTSSLGVQVWEFTGIPIISNVNATSITSTTADITWATDVIANSTVIYGVNRSNLNLTAGDASFVLSHVISLSSLLSNTTYFFNVSSCNSNGCTSNGTYNFTTSSVAEQAPVIWLTNPSSGTIQNLSSISLFYNVTDANSNIENSTLILNGIRNITNQSSILSGRINNFTLTLADGFYTWTVNVTDSTGLIGTNLTLRNFTIDTIAPNITLYNPFDNQSMASANIFFNFSVFDGRDSILVCDLIVDSVVLENDFNAPNSTFINYTETITAGTHFWNVTCIDDASNTGRSVTRNFTITDTPPSLTLIAPAPANISSTGNMTFIYNATDDNGFRLIRLILNGLLNMTNQTAILNGEYNNFTLFNLPEGFYTWTVNVTDSTNNNVTTTARNFTVDIYPPSIALNLPANATISNTSALSFNFTAFDNIDTSLTCSLSVGVVQDNNFAVVNGTLTNRQITGLIDGLQFWNVTCIDDALHQNISVSRTINITERPRIQLSTTNNSFFNVSVFNLSYVPTDNTNLSSCSLYIDGVLNTTNQTAVRNGQQNNFTMSGLSEGIHRWFVSCNDLIGLQNQSENRTFTLDLDGLTITLLAPPNDDQIFSSSVTFSYNVTDNLDATLECNVTVDSQVVNISIATNGAITNRTVSFLSGGTKYWNVTCMDDSSNKLTSLTRNFTLAFAPVISLNNPNSGLIQNSSNITLYYYVNDDNENIANATLILNGLRNITNQTEVVNDAENTFNLLLPDGFYTWTVNVTDTTGLIGTNLTLRNFTIDTTAPNITLLTPVNNSLQTWNNITFNFTVTDNLDSLLSCDLYVSHAIVLTNLNVTNGTNSISYIVRADGTYNWSTSCKDDANNTRMSSLFNFSVESPPNVTLVSPANNLVSNSSSIQFSYIPSDAIGFANCSLIIDDIVNDSNNEPDNGLTNTFNVNGLLQGNHNWTVECIDADPDFNAYRPTVRNFSVDSIYPMINLAYPVNNTNVLRSVSFNFTAIDNIDTNLTCNLYIDNALNVSSINAPNATEVVRTVNGHTLGSHIWNVSCMDDANNLNWSQIWNYNVTLADLMINSTNIILNVSSPIENENVLINATIVNLVNVTVSNITVSFFNGDPASSGVQIGSNQTITTLSALSQTTISVSWSATIGTNNIFVVVDPPTTTNGSIEEWNELNNKANTTVQTGAWHFVYGKISTESEFELARQNNLSIIRWSSVNVDNGNVYVTDLDSSISWTQLQAIGKNTTSENASNDFTDLDTLLSMTGLSDSVTSLYTSGGIVRNTSNFLVFNRQINDVPVRDSTNSSSFITGILWDMSDDNNTQYDQSNREDILFVTRINQSQVGGYGTYDYEIRIPARLREYRTTDIIRTVFYTELR